MMKRILVAAALSACAWARPLDARLTGYSGAELGGNRRGRPSSSGRTVGSVQRGAVEFFEEVLKYDPPGTKAACPNRDLGPTLRT